MTDRNSYDDEFKFVMEVFQGKNISEVAEE